MLNMILQVFFTSLALHCEWNKTTNENFIGHLLRENSLKKLAY